jgi:hypothetical protein
VTDLTARFAEERADLTRQLAARDSPAEELERLPAQKKRLYRENRGEIRCLEADRGELVAAIDRLTHPVERAKRTVDDEIAGAWRELREGLGVGPRWWPARVVRYVLGGLTGRSGRAAAADLRSQVSALEQEIHSLRYEFGSDG